MSTGMGVIGCGGHAFHHALNYRDHFYTAGAWDPNVQAADQMGNRFDRLEEMITDERIKAVMICSPDEFHLEQIKMSLEAGKHVFCEKPLLVPGQRIEDLIRCFELAKDRGLVVTTCHPRRFDPPFVWLKGLVTNDSTESRYGKVVSFDFDLSYHEPSNPWKNDRSLLLDHLNHEVDLMNFLFGIQGFDAWKLYDSHDRYEVSGKRDDDITFNFRGTRRLKQHVYPEWCRVRFERGEFYLDLMLGRAFLSDHDEKSVRAISDLKVDYDFRLRLIMRDFAVSIAGGEKYISNTEMLMNTEVGLILQNNGIQRVSVR